MDAKARVAEPVKSVGGMLKLCCTENTVPTTTATAQTQEALTNKGIDPMLPPPPPLESKEAKDKQHLNSFQSSARPFSLTCCCFNGLRSSRAWRTRRAPKWHAFAMFGLGYGSSRKRSPEQARSRSKRSKSRRKAAVSVSACTDSAEEASRYSTSYSSEEDQPKKTGCGPRLDKDEVQHFRQVWSWLCNANLVLEFLECLPGGQRV